MTTELYEFNHMLPTFALFAGLQLQLWKITRGFVLDRYRTFQFILADRQDNTLHSWPEGYNPSFMELWETCERLARNQ